MKTKNVTGNKNETLKSFSLEVSQMARVIANAVLYWKLSNF